MGRKKKKKKNRKKEKSSSIDAIPSLTKERLDPKRIGQLPSFLSEKTPLSASLISSSSEKKGLNGRVDTLFFLKKEEEPKSVAHATPFLMKEVPTSVVQAPLTLEKDVATGVVQAPPSRTKEEPTSANPISPPIKKEEPIGVARTPSFLTKAEPTSAISTSAPIRKKEPITGIPKVDNKEALKEEMSAFLSDMKVATSLVVKEEEPTSAAPTPPPIRKKEPIAGIPKVDKKEALKEEMASFLTDMKVATSVVVKEEEPTSAASTPPPIRKKVLITGIPKVDRKEAITEEMPAFLGEMKATTSVVMKEEEPRSAVPIPPLIRKEEPIAEVPKVKSTPPPINIEKPNEVNSKIAMKAAIKDEMGDFLAKMKRKMRGDDE